MNYSKKERGFESPESFFFHFKKHNKFDYHEDNDYWDEFEYLSDHMNWTSFQYSAMKKKFEKLMLNSYESEQSEYNENSADEYDEEEGDYNDSYDGDNDNYDNDVNYDNEDNYDNDDDIEDNHDIDDDNDEASDDNDDSDDSHYCENNSYNYYDYFYHEAEKEKDDDYFTQDGDRIIIENISSLYQYFDLYCKFFKFKYDGISDAVELFEELSNFMGWKKGYWYHFNQIDREIGKQDKIKYVKALFQKNKTNLVYKNDLDPKVNFEKLAYEKKWKKYYQRKEEFDILIGFLSDKKLDTLKKLHNIMKRYGLHKHRPYPTRIEDCKYYLKRNLFVNIYDFISIDNNKQFKDLNELRKYTVGPRKYPLDRAKSDDVHKILLKHINTPENNELYIK